jgi:ferritin
MLEAFNEQLQNELESSYLYLAMAAHFNGTALPGFARWMRLQSQEEYAHAMKFFDFIHQRDGRVQLRAIEQPAAVFASPLDVFERALEHERSVTERIHHLFGLAQQERDYASQTFLQWFVDEQVEEEDTARGIVDHLRLAGGNATALLFLDRELASRAALPPDPGTASAST